MSCEVPYRAVEYGNGDNEEAVALVTGLAGATKDLDRAARELADTGRDAVVYAYHPRLLLAGEANLLPEFIDTINADFMERTGSHDLHRFCGVSLGGAIAAGMQKSHESPEHGLYAATGVDAAELVMNNRLFRAVVMATRRIDVRRRYESNGYTLDDLKEEWQDIQQPPTTTFSVALGGLDYIVRSREIMPKIAAWQEQGTNIQVINKPWLGHMGTIKWFNNHILSMLATAPDNAPATDLIELIEPRGNAVHLSRLATSNAVSRPS